MKSLSIALVAFGLSVSALAPAFAHDGERGDIRRIRQDRAELRASEAQFRQEVRELKGAVSRAEAARRTGHPFTAWRAEREAKREVRDVIRAREQVVLDREQLSRDRARLARDRD